MGRLLLCLAALFAFSLALSRPQAARPVEAAVRTATAPAEAAPTVAYRPGEPMLVPGQSVDLPRAPDGHFYADALVNGQPVAMLVDTGASTVALTITDAQRLGLAVDPAAFQVVGSGASGPVRGAPVQLDTVALGPFSDGPVRAVVVEGLDRSLLGQSWLGRLDQVRIEADTMTLR
jgi:aspartyl protease family protein